MILKTSAGAVDDRYTIWDKTHTNIENIDFDELKINNHINNPKTDTTKDGKAMRLKDNMFYIINKPLFDQNVIIKNKKLFFIIFLYILSYFKSK